MPAKTIHPIGDQSGGVNTFANERDIDDRQYTVGINVDSSIPGEIRCVGEWGYYYTESTGFSSINFTGGGNNDMHFSNTFASYTGPLGATQYEIEVTVLNSGGEDDFKWKKQLNAGGYGGYTTVEMSDNTNPPELDNGIKVYWTNPDTGHQVGDKWVFTAGVDSFADVKPGYGIFPFQTDFDHTGAASEGHYLAVAKTVPDTETNLVVSMYHQPQVSLSNITDSIISIPHADENLSAGATADFIWVDGALRIFDASLTGDDHNFFPYKWRLEESGLTYFKGAANNDLAITTSTWQTTRQQLVSPSGGKCVFTGHEKPLDWATSPWNDSAVMKAALGITTAGDNVGLLIMGYEDSQDDTEDWTDGYVGWGKDATTSADYYFYYSYLYENSQESLLFKYPSVECLGGGVFNTDYNTGKKVTFMPIVNPGADAASWSRRITGIRLYYSRAEEETDVQYFIGEFPVTQTTTGGDDIAARIDDAYAVATLLGDKSGNPFGGTTTGVGIGYSDVGIFMDAPPTIFTHATMSGIRNTTESIACKYKTATLVNRRLYVGNIKQKTEESNGVEKKYPDRIIKSLPNKFDILPDNEFIDVAIRDGEEVIKLESLGSRLLQFKQNTLYTIAVAGGEEYLDGTYKNMGVLHPNAVTKTDFGIFWVNRRGAYLYTGEGAPTNLIDGKIDLKYWREWMTKDAITGYMPKEKRFLVINDSANVWGNANEIGGSDMFIYNILTQSWNHCTDVVGSGGSLDAVSNIVNYVDSDKEINTILLVGEDSLYEYRTIDEINNNSRAVRPFQLKTKDIHAGAPHVRKKFYKAFITYKGLGIDGNAPSGAALPVVQATIISPTGYNTISLVGDPGFDIGTSTDTWRTAEYKVDNTSTEDKANSRNAYSVQLNISGLTTYQNFKINDISLVFRPKSVK